MTMKIQRTKAGTSKGFAIVHLAVTMTGMLLFTGIAVDAGRGYVVKTQLTKAVDGAALGAARSLNSGTPKAEAARIFKANFPDGYLGTSAVTDPTTAGDFYSLSTDADGVNHITVKATAVVPTTFMRLANFEEMTVRSQGEATRRMVDLSLILDVSSSIGGQWAAVRDAARTFVKAFDAKNDRMALVTYGNGAAVLDQMTAARGFNKDKIVNDIATNLPGGSTAMVEGLYRGWDELRSVPAGNQSGLRVIVLFTDGASNSVPGIYPGAATARGLRTFDFPKNNPDPDGQTWNNPQIVAFFDTQTGDAVPNPASSVTVANWSDTTTLGGNAAWMPTQTAHTHHRSSGIPTGFPLQTNLLKVNGAAQNTKRGLRNFNVAQNKYPADVWNINNAARNVLEIIADAARSDNGDYKIRVYTIGMGLLVRHNLGTMPEKPEDILKRIANDKGSADYNKNQLEGKYYYATSGADVGAAFQALQNQIIRLTK